MTLLLGLLPAWAAFPTGTARMLALAVAPSSDLSAV